MKHLIKYTVVTFMIATGLLLLSCETEYEPDTSQYPVEYVVEGFIELANQDVPTVIYVSRTLPFFDRIDSDALKESFVRDAEVTVTMEGGESVTLTEICVDELDPAIAEAFRDLLLVTGVFRDLCVYVDLNNEIEKRPNTRYNLEIIAGDDVLTAATTIPDTVPANRLFHEAAPGNVDDQFRDFGIEFTDPVGQVDFYRTLTGVNSLPLYSNNASVFDDVFFDGQTFSFPIPRPVYPGDEVSIDSVGLYTVGDTVQLKWMTLDAEHYDFWSSLEFDSNSGGPFASYTRANSNVDGALGIWGGYSAYYYTYVIAD